MSEIHCPYCHEKLGEFKLEVSVAQGQMKCPYCGKSFGWNIRVGEVQYIW
jgi:uncharacterized Zn-finger protein